ncbi:aminotransferase-like domain-containing protein [Streptococcus sp. DD13]|uniref:aminotransferase-like domain-containing protein n=1 Tax=Streptococcus sp. DD13 TaxID=1777881 RepID=UPI0007937886|nr:PLP-dependent aminotransferase family protein [Streptococcus sp. DD13]KXT78547.1 putative transcriptional regulator of pyridoxine metabolism [Streptococcus sp. DD13]
MKKYEEIIQDLKEKIENGTLERGQKLPSIRKLSEKYNCSKDTAIKALQELRYQHLVYSVEKSGYYVLEDPSFQDQTVSFDSYFFEELPYEDFRTCVNESLVGRERYLFNYYHRQEGLEELINSVHTLLMDYSVYSKKEQLVITAGSQQALYILSQMSFPTPGQGILMEKPSYHRMEELASSQGQPYATIERTIDGIDLEELERLFASGHFKFFYTIPRLHNPLGTSYRKDQAMAILRLAEKYQVYLIEDDYLADFAPSSSLPLYYQDPNHRVIYIKSFTTTLFPALRIGCVVLPSELVSAFLQLKGLMDYDTNLIMQKALSLYIDNGMFAKNTKLLKDRFHTDQEQTKRNMEKFLPLGSYQMTQQGILLPFLRQELTAEQKHHRSVSKVIEGQAYCYLLFSGFQEVQDFWKQCHQKTEP